MAPGKLSNRDDKKLLGTDKEKVRFDLYRSVRLARRLYLDAACASERCLQETWRRMCSERLRRGSVRFSKQLHGPGDDRRSLSSVGRRNLQIQLFLSEFERSTSCQESQRGVAS